jgi:CBS domain containing-hemolysin-like protein
LVAPFFAGPVLLADLLLASSRESSSLLLIIGLLAIPLLVGFNGFFVAAEFALVAIRRTRVEELVNQGKPGAASLMYAITELNRSVAACQLGITVASLALGFVSEPAIHRIVHPTLAVLPAEWGRVVSISLTLLLITYLHVVFGEQMPKIAALHEPERIGLWVAGPVNLFARMTGPLIRLMNGSSSWFLRRLGYTSSGEEAEIHTVEELSLLVEDTAEEGLIDPDAADMVLNVFALADKKVRDCMVPRDQMMALDVNTPPAKVLEVARLGAHTRMPVYEGSLDKIVGIVNTKDLFFLFSTSGVVLLEDALYPATFLDPDEPVANAFRLFRKSHRPMALVRDASGTVVGLLTLEDVLEEIVGDIEDEHDVPVPKLKLARRRAGITKLASGTHGLPEPRDRKTDARPD